MMATFARSLVGTIQGRRDGYRVYDVRDRIKECCWSVIVVLVESEM
jgi:hypothetical protein